MTGECVAVPHVVAEAIAGEETEKSEGQVEQPTHRREETVNSSELITRVVRL